MATIKPLGNRVLVRRSKARTSRGGILLPDTAQEKPREGEVVAVGEGKYDDEGQRQTPSVKVGDRVLFTPYAGTEVKQAGHDKEEEYLIMSEEDLLGILR
jgi:chaperonin GroES